MRTSASINRDANALPDSRHATDDPIGTAAWTSRGTIGTGGASIRVRVRRFTIFVEPLELSILTACVYLDSPVRLDQLNLVVKRCLLSIRSRLPF